MRFLAKLLQRLCWLVLVLGAFAGCVSKSKADAEARAAYLAGQRDQMQRQAAAQAQAQTQVQTQAVSSAQDHSPAVMIQGPVQNNTIPWVPGLTLLKALAAAQYTGAADPAAIIIVRAGRGTQYDPKRLLDGEDRDPSLQPQDVIVLR
jgi:hypothetical protein